MIGRGLPKMGHKGPFSRVQFHRDRIDHPFRWKKPRRIFVCSMGDLFHEDVTDRQVDDVIYRIALLPRHTFMILTKRPERMKRFFDGYPKGYPMAYEVDFSKGDIFNNPDALIPCSFAPWPLPNLWLGVTAENQDMADQRIPILLQTPAAKRFVSVEPMLGPVDLTRVDEHGSGNDWAIHGDALHGGLWERRGRADRYKMIRDASRLDWVIGGGETGPDARPMHPDYPRSLRDQCQAAGIPFFFKGWGTYGMKKSDPGYMKIDGREWKEFPKRIERYLGRGR
jgi:protein gp37